MRYLNILLMIVGLSITSSAQNILESSSNTYEVSREIELNFKSYSFVFVDHTYGVGAIVFSLIDYPHVAGQSILPDSLESDPMFLNYAIAYPNTKIYVSLETSAGIDLSAFEISIQTKTIYNDVVLGQTPLVEDKLILEANATKSLWISDLMWKSSGANYNTTPPSGLNRGVQFVIGLKLNSSGSNFSSSYGALTAAMKSATLNFIFTP
jgi:hypothetical protein